MERVAAWPASQAALLAAAGAPAAGHCAQTVPEVGEAGRLGVLCISNPRAPPATAAQCEQPLVALATFLQVCRSALSPGMRIHLTVIRTKSCRAGALRRRRQRRPSARSGSVSGGAIPAPPLPHLLGGRLC